MGDLQRLELIRRIRELYRKTPSIKRIHQLLRLEGIRLAPLTIKSYVEDLIAEEIPQEEKKQRFWKLLEDTFKTCSSPRLSVLARQIGIDWRVAKTWYQELLGKLPKLDWQPSLQRLYDRGLGKLTIAKLVSDKTDCNLKTIRDWLYEDLESTAIPRLFKQIIIDLDKELPKKVHKVPKKFKLDRPPPGNLPRLFQQEIDQHPAFQQAFKNLITKGYSQREILQAWANKRGNTGLQTRLPKTLEFEEFIFELDQNWPSRRLNWEPAIDLLIEKGYQQPKDLAELLKISSGRASTYIHKRIEPSYDLQKMIIRLSQELPYRPWSSLDPNAWKEAVQKALDKGYKRKTLCKLLSKNYPEIKWSTAQEWILVARKSPRLPEQLKIIEFCNSLPKLPWADLQGYEWKVVIQQLLKKTEPKVLIPKLAKKLQVAEDSIATWIRGTVVPSAENQWKIINYRQNL